jgi:hypothetical protein
MKMIFAKHKVPPMNTQQKPNCFTFRSPLAWTGLALCLNLLAVAPRAAADVFIIESRTGGQNFGDYGDVGFAASSLKSSAPGCTAGIGSRYGFNTYTSATLSPTVAVPGGLYELDVTHGSASSISADLMVDVTVTGGVFTNTVTHATSGDIWTTAFQKTAGVNAWITVGANENILLNPGVTSFSLYFSTTNTDLNSTTNRFYSDAYRLTYYGDPCLQGLAELYAIDGPLYAGQTNVTVPGVSASATNINVYTNGVLAGSLSHGIVAGVNVVPTSALVKGSFVTATQTGTNGVESCNNSQGTMVGGGSNPQIRVSLSLETDPALTGPVGAAGTTTSGNYFFLDATGSAGIGGFGTAPAGGQVIYPSTNWQTITFNPGDSGYYWAGAFSGSETIQGSFAQLDAIAFCIDDLTDTGPFSIYIDDIMNGTNVIQNFESVPAGTIGAQFTIPGTSLTTSPDLLAQAPGTINPNVSVVSRVASPTGTNSCLVSWQFNSTAAVNWLRLSALSSVGGTTPAPQFDLSQPISFNVLLEPVGQTAPLPPTLTPPTLLTTVAGTTLTLNWSGSYYLQSTTNLSTAWSDVGVTNSPYSTSMTNKSHLFFRLSQQP